MICGRCGWFIPTDCTCRRNVDRLAAARFRDVAEKRHREAVARALRSGWAIDRAVAGLWRAAG